LNSKQTNLNYTPIVEKYLPKVKPVLTASQKSQFAQNIGQQLKAQNAVLIAHYYAPAEVQALAEASGGFVGDSLAMAQFGGKNAAQKLIIAGVKFMGETAKILSPEKTVMMPTLDATCSLDLNCPAEEFSTFCDAHPDRTVVVYSNTSAAVKACADWVVTSSIALPIIEHLHEKGEKILWASDKHLGAYLQRKTEADILSWDAACIVHEEFKAKYLLDLKAQHPDAAILAHAESPLPVLEIADIVGSTSQLLKAAKQLSNTVLLVATEEGIFYKMKQLAPNKQLILAPAAGKGATCRSCGHCPWMKMNDLQAVASALANRDNEIFIAEEIREQALTPVQRMMNFAAQYHV